MKEFVFATGNKGKLAEMSALAKKYGVIVHAPNEFQGTPPEVEEIGTTYEENAALKAEAFFKWTGIPAIADDTGLEVEALNGGPGLYSARYAGDPCTPQENRTKMLAEMAQVQNRRAEFKSVICLYSSEGAKYFYGSLKGEITREEIGDGGFGFDPIFKVDGYDKTLAQLKGAGVEIKTHRIEALEKCLLTIKNS